MKMKYVKPEMAELRIRPTGFICTSGWEVMEPGEPNMPAGVRELLGDWDFSNQETE